MLNDLENQLIFTKWNLIYYDTGHRDVYMHGHYKYIYINS